ncbi:sensor histidine kinase [Phenylobacterium sp.]|uniref:sensor histidine kinase n=1 Tax=Phenylobacterium sp. TaxID=1871053 RepID=UPI0035B3D53D
MSDAPLADVATLAAELASARQALAEETVRADALNRIAAAIGAGGDLEQVVQTVVDGGVELTGAAFGAFFYFTVEDATGDRLTLYTLSGAPRSAFEHFPMLRKTAVFAPTFDGTGIIRSDDITADPRYGRNAPYHGMPKGHLPVRSYLAVPVVSRSGEVLGGLFFGHPEPARFTERLEHLMAGVGAQAAVAIDNVRLHKAARAEVAERRAAEERQRLLLNELNHRVKNTLASVQSIARQSLQNADDVVTFRRAFEARLMALSQTHNLLTAQNWEGASLLDILAAELRPHGGGRAGGGSRFTLEGEVDVKLKPKAAVALGMAVHELATNALKYGALSAPEGHVALRLHLIGREDDRRLVIEWVESGGPAVSQPARKGFGSRLLERGLTGELAGRVRLDYDPAGLSCRMELPLRGLEPSE